ncbi:hypothetical protein I4U23_001422 [Adineta vaga]|nr:hypothetical protein I4U23_001422 [Adineta vaga]
MSASDNTESKTSLKLSDLTVDNITKNAIQTNSETPNFRFKFLMEKLINHLHNYIRETRLTTEEWTQTIQFLTSCGQISNDVRQEFILLSDILGVSVLVDALNHPKPSNATESTVLGPFYTEDAVDVANGESIASPNKGEICLVLATVKNTRGEPIEGAKIDVWETDGNGLYDNQYENRDKPDMRGRLTTNQQGEFYFTCVKPVSYAVPTDGPVGKLLKELHRRAYRPAHIHFRIYIPDSEYDDLVTALYVQDDPYLMSDAVFGVKKVLLLMSRKLKMQQLLRCMMLKNKIG